MVQNDYFYISQSEFWYYFLQSRDAYKILSYSIKDKEQRDLFNRYVSVINIETSAWCNRSCSYCPVGIIKPKREQSYMLEYNFMKILNELQSIDYRGIIKLNLFNEPLADSDNLINRILQINQFLPHVYISINSNGDYLTPDLLERLNKSGLKEMLITVHTEPDEEYTDADRMNRIQKILKKLNINEKPKSIISNKNITYDFIYKDIRLILVANNWHVYGIDRAGIVSHLSANERSHPCMVPFREISINYEGYIQQCWNIYFTEFNYGNITNNSLLNVYFSDRMVQLRRDLFLFGSKEKPCKTCKALEMNCKEDNDLRIKILSQTS